MIRSPLMTVMTEAVMKAARSLKRDFGEVENLQVSRKGPGDFVSAADRKAEKIIREPLEKARPGYGFVMEESGIVVGTDQSHRWHIDPLDGTTNFLHGLPHFAISVGLEREARSSPASIYDPVKDELFIAEKGKGAFLNNRRLRVAARGAVEDAVVACGLPHIGQGRSWPVPARGWRPSCPRSRACGASARRRSILPMSPAGASTPIWERGLNSWDIAAGMVLDPRGRRLHFGRGRRQRAPEDRHHRLRQRSPPSGTRQAVESRPIADSSCSSAGTAGLVTLDPVIRRGHSAAMFLTAPGRVRWRWTPNP